MRFKTRPPVRFYGWLVATALFTCYLLWEGMVIWGALIYTIVFVILYWIMCGENCSITWNGDVITITYFKTFWQSHIFNVQDIVSIEFKKGDPFWELLLEMDGTEKHYRAMDKFIIHTRDSQSEFRIGTNRADLSIIIREFKKGIS